MVSISILDKFGYTCSFGNNKFSLFQNSNLVGTGSLSYVDNLYMLDTVASYHETLQLSTQGVKRKLTDENSSSLWHKRLGHISKRRIERLVSDGILDSLILQILKFAQITKRENKQTQGDLVPTGLQMSYN